METPDEMQARWDKAIKEAGVATEAEMEAADVPWPKTVEDLTAYINKLVNRPHNYGTCAYAMSMAAVAAFQYVAHELGVTGFQASCADMDILRRTRHMKLGFMITNVEKLLYPQSEDVVGELVEYLEKQQAALGKEARRLLDKTPNAHPDVIQHWKLLAKKA